MAVFGFFDFLPRRTVTNSPAPSASLKALRSSSGGFHDLAMASIRTVLLLSVPCLGALRLGFALLHRGGALANGVGLSEGRHVGFGFRVAVPELLLFIPEYVNVGFNFLMLWRQSNI